MLASRATSPTTGSTSGWQIPTTRSECNGSRADRGARPRGRCRSHKRPNAPDDDSAAVLGGTKTYIRDFDQSLPESHSAQELAGKMMALHGDPYTLWTAAQGVFKQGQGASP